MLTLAVALALAAYGAYVPARADAAVTPGPAGAVAAGVDGPSGVTPGQVAAAVAEIKQSGQAYDTFTAGGQRYVSVKFGTGSTFNLPDTTSAVAGQRIVAPPRGSLTPDLGGGGGITSPYVSFNQVDQTALITGGAAVLTGAICFIPAVGPVACAVAGVVAAVAAVYVDSYGRCPASRPNLRIYVYGGQGYLNGCYR